MKNIIIITGGAGFVGSNLIKYLLKKTKFKIISLDNYSSGTKKNHILSSRIKYLRGNTLNIEKILFPYKKKFIHYFILESFPEYIKALKIFMNVLILTLLDQKRFLSFA